MCVCQVYIVCIVTTSPRLAGDPPYPSRIIPPVPLGRASPVGLVGVVSIDTGEVIVI